MELPGSPARLLLLLLPLTELLRFPPSGLPRLRDPSSLLGGRGSFLLPLSLSLIFLLLSSPLLSLASLPGLGSLSLPRLLQSNLSLALSLLLSFSGGK